MNIDDALAWVDRNVGDAELVYSLRAAVVARTLADRVREVEAENVALRAQVYALSGANMG